MTPNQVKSHMDKDTRLSLAKTFVEYFIKKVNKVDLVVSQSDLVEL